MLTTSRSSCGTYLIPRAANPTLSMSIDLVILSLSKLIDRWVRLGNLRRRLRYPFPLLLLFV
ncbi:unnamed protein product [Periconia digitata]|uniref:Uncharacterized protein n=1 Tax=Periconia digitata TaxID=1303443 RepID=A0A9W4U7I1_9PLEO|nr:unnamed protein product [Periconia digitata]